MPFAELPGCRLFYTFDGAGPPLLFVHGGACTHRDWDAQVKPLAEHFTVVRIDARGHGASLVDDATTCTIDEVAADINRLLDLLQVGPAVLIGHSTGCRRVLQAAVDRPDQTAGVILVDGSRVWSGDLAEVRQQQDVAFADARAQYRTIFESPSFFRHADSATRERIRASMEATDEAVLRASAFSTGPWDATRLEDVVRALRPPLLAIQSTYWSQMEARRGLLPSDISTPWIDLLRTLKPETRSVLLTDVGHFSMIEAADQVNAAILAFALEAHASTNSP